MSKKYIYYRSLVVYANWLIILERFYIAYATNTFSRFSNVSQLGHLKGIIRVFG